MTFNQAPEGDVVVTTTESGQIILVSRQDEDGRVLSVIAFDDVISEPVAEPSGEARALTPTQLNELLLKVAPAVSELPAAVKEALIQFGRSVELAHGIR